MNPKLFSVKILGIVLATAFMAGCGTSTNPTSDYNLPQGVPVTENPNHTITPPVSQSVLPGNAFRVDIPSNMNFVEGQPNSYSLKIVSVLKGLTYSLQPSSLPAGVSLNQVSATEWSISGTVPVGSSAGQMQGEKVSVTISAVASGDKASLAKFNSILHSWSPTVTVFPTDKPPIVESQKMGLSVSEGQSLPIEIIVTDVGSHGGAMPEIQSPFQDEMQNGEVTFVVALPGLRMSRTPVAIGGGKFKFSGTLNTKMLSLPEGKKNITARFVVNFKSPSGLVSADEIVDVKIVRAAAPAPVAQPAQAAAAQPAPAAPTAAAPAQVSASVQAPAAQATTTTAAAADAAAPATTSTKDASKPVTPKKKTAAKKTVTKKKTATKTTATKTESK